MVVEKDVYSSLVASMPIAYAWHKMLYNESGEAIDYCFLDVNTAFEEMTGLSANQVVGKTVLELLPATEYFWIKKYQECIQTGEKIYFENFSQSLNKYFQVIAYSTAPEHFITLFFDITDRKIEFQKSEDIASFYQAITENASDGVVIIDASFRHKYISPNVYKMFGYEPGQLRSLVLSEFTHPDDLENVTLEMMKAIENPDYKPTLEFRFRKSNGEWVWLESKFSNLFHLTNINGFVINFVDISEKRNRMQMLKQSEALLAATLKHSRFSIWSVDLNCCILYANATFSAEFFQTFGVEIKIGVNIIDILPEPLKLHWLDRHRRALANKSFIEEDVINSGDSTIYIEVSTVPILVDGVVVGASFYGENVTERKVAKERLVANTQNLSKILQAANEFIKPKLSHVNFDVITHTMSEISGANFVILNKLHSEYSQTVSICGLSNARETIQQYLDIDIFNYKWKRGNVFDSKWVINKRTYFPDFYSIASTELKQATLSIIDNTFQVGGVYVVRIEGNSRVIGNLILVFEKGKQLENSELIEMFSFQLGQYMERLNVEDVLHQKMDEMERFHKLTVNRELNMIELKMEVNELLKQAGKAEKYKIVKPLLSDN